MFDPRVQTPLPIYDAKTVDIVFEDGKPFLVASYCGTWIKLKINNDHLWSLFDRITPKLRGR